ncbi:16S rRNA (uracil(1498)-N(3))-methyltransferase [Lentibacillus salicampi]|uniref:Ribosomal RNA small subunit methyltransferase E n=1 Tax=Lentibacillus salicampi TaxID=175306 RepID=A0A4Y9AFJ6_9BACI|nr:16S rRNA (uracil(1498)-N(3))-methyltransferase [Lentibacillus salicampi]TFJ94122.1 16S rRNA (uracil(1498)-N(3))-methyltransferase [Lentibacillus salicampi]
MQRYFVPAENWIDSQVIITGDDVHHISRVIRSRPGNKIICNHPNGDAAICRITDIGKDQIHTVISEWLEESSELPLDVTIAQGLPKSDKLEWVLQKGTELGAAAFIPVQADRSVVVWDHQKSEKKMNRYRKIIKEASEQSHRNKIPSIKPVTPLTELVKQSTDYNVKLFAYEEEAKTEVFQSFGMAVSKMGPGDRVFIVIGPEGGFSKQEAAVLKQHDFTPVRLGPRILRTETAALYALASISYHFEELRCT